MGFTDRLKIALAAFRGEAGLNLPDGGRSSEETFGNMLSSFLAPFGTISPVINFEMLRAMKMLWIYNPDFSQYVANIVNLGNPGHKITIEARSDAMVAAAMDRINETSVRIYPGSCGVDGLLNQYLTSVAWSGAVSSEDIVNLAARRVEKVVLVPVEQIRFKYNRDLDVYDAYQKTPHLVRTSNSGNAIGLNPLNPETYKYFALQTVENSPYAKPPATAAVEAIIDGQKPIMENIRYIAQKFGLMGMVTASLVPPPKKPGEAEGEYQTRATKYQMDVARVLEGNFKKGLLVTFRDQKIEHTNVAEGGGDVYQLNRMSEEQIFSGMGAMPGFHGRTDSTTETFADVVYYLLTAQTGGMQRIVQRRQEQTYRLDLRLGGIDVDAIHLSFNKAHSRNALAEAQTDQIHLANTLSKVESGIISPDHGAQELGYDNWFDVEMLVGKSVVPTKSLGQSFARNGGPVINLAYDRERHKYSYQPERLGSFTTDDAAADTVVPFIKKKAQQA